MPQVEPDDGLVTYDETASLLGCSVRTVHRLREDGALDPVVVRTPRNAVTVRFRRSQVLARANRASS